MPVYDAAIIGGGPAGLSAAIYLARLNRSVVLLTRGPGQTGWHQVTENYFGFPRGIRAAVLVGQGTRQAQKFGATVVEAKVGSIRRRRDRFAVRGDYPCQARAVILCTGVMPDFPVFPGSESFIGRSLFDCLICHAFAVRGRKTVVVGHDDAAALTCLQLRRFTPHPVLLTNCEQGCDQLTGAARERLRKARVRILRGVIKAVRGRGGMMREIILHDGCREPADFMFSRQSHRPNSELGAALGVVIEGEGYIHVDRGQRTSEPMVYAAGDVCSANDHQIVCAAQQGAKAALSANEDLAAGLEIPW